MGVQAEIDAFNKKAAKLAGDQVRAIGFHINDRAAEMTPVISGRLKGGWLAEDGRSADGEVFVDIKNPVEYAVYVEEGTDRMTPRRMLSRAIAEAKAML